jgi:thiamine-monophosphate kinase
MASDRADSEEAIIGAFFAPLAAGFPGAFGLQDDCATIAPGPGAELVVTTDAVIAGVHFFAGEDAGSVAWKALAVNVSDLVAKGAAPLAYLMTLALPEAPERAWLSAFADGLGAAQAAFGCHLAGGDTDRTPGPLSVSITALGTIPVGCMVRRATARPGDAVYVSGTIGDGYLGLALRRDSALAERCRLDPGARASLDTAYCRPLPPVALAPVVRDCASAAMDISDGLIKDFDRMCRAAGVGGCLESARVPLSAPARAVVARAGATLADLLTGGEDYQVLAAIAPERAAEFERLAAATGTSVTRIGAIDDVAAGVRVVDERGDALAFARTGWDHFARAPAPPRNEG